MNAEYGRTEAEATVDGTAAGGGMQLGAYTMLAQLRLTHVTLTASGEPVAVHGCDLIECDLSAMRPEWFRYCRILRCVPPQGLSWRDTIECWIDPPGMATGHSGAAPNDGSGAPSLMERHQEHYRACNCLGDSDVCCVPDCECHGVTDA